MKKPLFLLRHYPPDVGALSFRMKHAAETLAKEHEVYVLAAQPNRYAGTQAAQSREVLHGVHVRRTWHGRLFRGKGKYNRGLTELLGALWMTVVALAYCRKVDVVLVSNPPLLNTIPGWFLHRVCGLPLIVDLRDLWLDWAEESGVIRSKTILKILHWYERSLLNSAKHITVTTKGFKESICERFRIDTSRVTIIYNGLDEIVRLDDSSVPETRKTTSLEMRRILYAGNLGPSQNLLGIAKGCVDSVRKWPNLEISIVGDGMQWSKLKELEEERFHVHARVDREELKRFYAQADAFLLHLADLRVYECTVPSKLFEFVSYGKPILCGVSGEARQLCRQYADCHEFSSDDSESFAMAVDHFMEGRQPQNAGEPRDDLKTVLRSQRGPLWEQVFEAI